MPIVKKLRKQCKRCPKMFVPTGKCSFLCKDCLAKALKKRTEAMKTRNYSK